MTKGTRAEHGGNGRVIAASVSAAVGAFLFGFDSAVINGAVDALSTHFTLGEFLKGFSVAIALLGCAVGAWYAGQLADRIGRKKVMRSASPSPTSRRSSDSAMCMASTRPSR